MKKIRVAVVGLGFIGGCHIDAIRRVFGTEIMAVSDVNEDAVNRYSSALGVKGYADYREMLEREDIDALHDCTPNSMHYDVTKAAIEAGVHVYGEKPLAATLEKGAELVRLANGKGVFCAVNFNYRANAVVWEMRERLGRIPAEGGAGRCFLIHGRYLQDWLSRAEDYDWRVTEAGDGPRALADIGSHWFDLARFVYGKKIVSVCAEPFVAYKTRIDKEVNSDDGAIVIARFEDGLAASLVISQVSNGYKNDLSISADCAEYSLRWRQQDADKLIIGRRNGGEETIFTSSQYFTGGAKERATLPAGHPVGWADSLKNSIQAFYDGLRSENSNCHNALCGFEDALWVMKVADACVRSGRSAKWVDV
ncbi:MAG: Gfo/Idh/MocA family oxidoreductase [Clostridiales bacterium]|jgi:predicted dehydrogenase|nr:Gfo/Idh/MocA family oxidoreductase [Clostridiales bacterium]